ncbi:HNH endonuclease [Changpingibacter yushuensis]|uniref:HNH endonuclease n=1 Tax=Changpingibacter yushuensis TaxID=2758440 RepID=UPI00165E98EA|nr:HNH endonuclease [Changpingibacter yushuensis]
MKQLKAEFFAQGQYLDSTNDTAGDCWICKKRIDYDVKPGTSDNSHELDHYYPVSLYPDLQEDPANFRHAHRKCNRERGNGQPKSDIGQLVPEWW